MRRSSVACCVALAMIFSGGPALHAQGARCRHAAFEGEVQAGAPFARPIGNGLAFVLQPIASGWIMRVEPLAGPRGEPDYAELATPPYRSVTPLSLSTDFSFRAQDAVGWNPRHFRFAPDRAAFARLDEAYRAWQHNGFRAGDPVQSVLARLSASSASGELTILDARLIPGTADQWRAAGAVASHFASTAHTVVDPDGPAATPLGKLLSIRFRVELELPPAFAPAPGMHIVLGSCSAL